MAARKKQKGKLSGINDDGTPNAYWRKFKERLEIYDQTPVEEWDHENVLGHIFRRYKERTNLDFPLSYSGPPSTCREVYCIKRMILQLGTEDYTIIKKYVDWVWDTIIIPKNLDLTSLAFFFTDNFIFQFKAELRKSQKITRTTLLPETFSSVDLNLVTYGDLAFARVALENDPENEEYQQYKRFLDLLRKKGFDFGVLNDLAC